MELQTKKKKKHVINLITAFMLGCFLLACSGGGGGDDLEPTPPSLIVNPLDLNFSPSKGDAKSLEIRTDADASWTIYIDDVLSSKISLSSSRGTGSTTVTLTTKEENEEEVKGQLQVVATKDGLSTTKSVSITLESSLPSACKVSIQKEGETGNENMMIMSYGFACVMAWESNTYSFRYNIYTDTEFNSIRGNNDKIIAEATKTGTKWKEIIIPSSGGIEIVYDECKPNTAYEFVWIPYTQKGQHGQIDSKHFVTKGDTDDQPLATVTPVARVSYNDVQGGNSGSYYKWSVVQNRSSDSYFTYVCASATETETMKNRNESEYGINKPQDGVSVAWEILNTVRHGWNESGVVDFNKNKSCREMLFTRSVKDGDFSFSYDSKDKYIQFVTWALDRSGNYSGMVYDVVYKVEDGKLIPQPDTPDDVLSANPLSLRFQAASGTADVKKIKVTSNSEWTASSSNDWCHLTKTFGTNDGTIDVWCDENNITSERSATITITTKGGKYVEITVTQEPKSTPIVIGRDEWDDDDNDKNLDGGGTTTYTLSISQTTLSTSAAGETKNVNVTSNDSWTVSSNQSWCSISPTSGSNNGTIKVTTSKNTSSNSRSATITIKGTNSGSKTIAVSQDAYTLSVSPSSLQMKSDGESKTVSVSSNDSWTVTSSQSWCTVSPSSGSNNGTITIKAASNSSSSRTATLTIKGTNSGRSVTVSVSQEAGTVIGRDEYGSDKEIK